VGLSADIFLQSEETFWGTRGGEADSLMAEASTIPPAQEHEVGWTCPDIRDQKSLFSDTASITSSIMRFREENGRTYHAFREGSKYYRPALTSRLPVSRGKVD
jgi:hypothetical protein